METFEDEQQQVFWTASLIAAVAVCKCFLQSSALFFFFYAKIDRNASLRKPLLSQAEDLEISNRGMQQWSRKKCAEIPQVNKSVDNV